MTTRLTLILAAIVIGLFVLDNLLFNGGGALFLAKKGIELIHFLAFWR